MPRTWFVCLTIVAAFCPPLFAAGPPTVMAPVPRPVLDAARTLGLLPDRDRVRFLPDFVRLAHFGSDERVALLEALRAANGAPTAAAGVDAGASASAPQVVVPLDADVWSAAIFKRPIPLTRLLTAIVVDRRAALLAAGLAGMDDETLAYLSGAPALLSDLYERGAATVAAFGASLRIHDGRVVTPGTADDRAVWEAVAGAPVTAPDRFIRQLFTPPGGGRLAYVYGTVALLDAAHARFALGPPADGVQVRSERLRALVALAGAQYGEWREDRYPYTRPVGDLALLLTRVQVDAAGQPLPPADRSFWEAVWQVPPTGGAGSGNRPASGGAGAMDAAWLADAAVRGNMHQRGNHLDQLAFAQRVFGAAATAASAEAVDAVVAFPRQKMLMLTLERMGFRAPAIFAFVSQRAARLELGDSNRGFWVMAQVQPALALVARMARHGSVTQRTAESLVRGLFTVPLDPHGHYAGGIARWLDRDLAPLLPPATDVDTSLLLALAGPPAGARARTIDWEGERYRIDFPAAELRRLQAVREKQGGPTVALAVALERMATTLADAGLDGGRLQAVHGALQQLPIEHAVAVASTATDTVPPGVEPPRRTREVLERVVAEVGQAARAGDVRRAARQAPVLHELVDVALAQALLSTAYALDLGDPEGAALLSRTAAYRHDFGFGRFDADTRARLIWAVPRQDFQPGVAWHVVGSALGLDLALARLSLTHINVDRLTGPPRVASLDRDAFAVGLALLDARQLRDDTRDAMVAALAKGRARVLAAATGGEPLSALADAVRFDALRRRGLALAQGAAPTGLPEHFSLAELVHLGGGPSARELAYWGANALPLSGCPCTEMVLPATWPLLAGRPQLPMGAAAVPDLNIRVAEVLTELGLPADLMRPVLAAAIQDFLADAAPIDGGDWWALSVAARAVSRERIEDYVAAAASVGGALIPDEDREP